MGIFIFIKIKTGMSKYLIVGLVNIGAEYQHSRHNIGFDVVDYFIDQEKSYFAPDRLADKAELRWKGKTFICIKPTTYMNLSGRAVKYWLDKEKIPIEQCLVIVDELALPLNKIRLRPGGSDAGHNGLKSIFEHLGTHEYPKLRFGIGNNFPKGMQVEYVLGRWNAEEIPVVKEKIVKCAEVIRLFATIGIAKTMNEVNKLEFGPNLA